MYYLPRKDSAIWLSPCPEGIHTLELTLLAQMFLKFFLFLVIVPVSYKIDQIQIQILIAFSKS